MSTEVKYETEYMAKLIRAMVLKYGVNGEVKLSKYDLGPMSENHRLFRRTEIDERTGSRDVFLKVTP